METEKEEKCECQQEYVCEKHTIISEIVILFIATGLTMLFMLSLGNFI